MDDLILERVKRELGIDLEPLIRELARPKPVEINKQRLAEVSKIGAEFFKLCEQSDSFVSKNVTILDGTMNFDIVFHYVAGFASENTSDSDLLEAFPSLQKLIEILNKADTFDIDNTPDDTECFRISIGFNGVTSSIFDGLK